MTRKDYQAVARVIRFNYENSDDQAKSNIREIARELADHFKTDNSRFDRQKFYEACGIS
jgi:hypothetical protein